MGMDTNTQTVHRPQDSSGTEDRLKRARRRAVRHNCRVHIEAIVRTAMGGESWSVSTVELKGRILDLLSDSVMLYTKESLMPNQDLRLTIAMPHDEPIVTAAIVRSSRPIPDKGGHATTVRFRGLAGKSQQCIERFLELIEAGKYA